MALVKFATICDCCGERSFEYTRFPICRECSNDCCAECAERDSMRDDDDRGWSCICNACSIAAAEERYWDAKIHARIEGDV